MILQTKCVCHLLCEGLYLHWWKNEHITICFFTLTWCLVTILYRDNVLPRRILTSLGSSIQINPGWQLWVNIWYQCIPGNTFINGASVQKNTSSFLTIHKNKKWGEKKFLEYAIFEFGGIGTMTLIDKRLSRKTCGPRMEFFLILISNITTSYCEGMLCIHFLLYAIMTSSRHTQTVDTQNRHSYCAGTWRKLDLSELFLHILYYSWKNYFNIFPFLD